MNKEIISIIKERAIHPFGYQLIKNAYIVNCKDNDYVIKLHTNNYDIYKYLTSRNLMFFPKNFNQPYDNYDLSLYIKGLNTNNEQRINEYIKIIALLHNKTSYKREIDLDEIKEKYEDLNNKITKLRKHYLDLNDKIDHEIFLSPSEYLLVRNISLIYSILDNSQVLLNEVYSDIKNEKSIRVSLLHNNVDLDHLIISDEEYLISWDKAYFDSPIIEIEQIYRKYYREISLNDLLKIYESINKLTTIERKLLLISLSIPHELKLTDNTYLDTMVINNEIKYLNKVYELLIKYRNEL